MTLLIEDRVLLAAFREGKRDALERIYRHYVNEVATFLRGGFTYLSDGRPQAFGGFRALELEAVVQDAFIRAFSASARASYDGLRPYRAFLFGVARNVALGALERRGAGTRLEPLDDHAHTLAADSTPPEETIDRREARELVAAFLAGDCDDRDRRLFTLRWDDGLSQEQAARAAGLTRIQVRRWETKFRARLLRHLKRARFVEDGA